MEERREAKEEGRNRRRRGTNHTSILSRDFFVLMLTVGICKDRENMFRRRFEFKMRGDGDHLPS